MKVRIPNSGGPGNMNQMLKQAQKMQNDMMKAKVKATGEIVNVYFRSPLWVNGDTKETYFPKELDTIWVEKREKTS